MKLVNHVILAILVVLALQLTIVSAADNILTNAKRAIPSVTKYTVNSTWGKQVPQDKPLSTVQAVYNLYEGAKQVGVTVATAGKGYSGMIYQHVVLDMKGTVVKVMVTEHRETPTYVSALADGSFLKQFVGITLADKMSLLIGKTPTKKGEIQAIAGATITSKPITIGTYEARKLFQYVYTK